jgi:hypothetical protein
MSDLATKAARLRTAQIIHGALIMGCVAVMALMILLRTQTMADQAPPDPPIVSYVLAGLGVLNLVLAYIVPGMIARTNAQRLDKSDEGAWWGLYQMQLIIGDALLEGAAFMQWIGYYLEGQLWVVGLGVVLLAALALRFPTLSHAEYWIEQQKRLTP